MAAVALTGCGSVAKKALENATGCKNVDVNNGGVSANCKDGSIGFGGNAKVPDGFPSELSPPKGAVLSMATKSTTGGTESYALTMIVPGNAKDVADGLRSQLKKAHYTISDDSISEGSDGVGGSLRGRNNTYEVLYSFGSNPNAKDADKGTFIIVAVHKLTADEKNESTTTIDSTTGSDSGSGSQSTTTDGSSGSDGNTNSSASGQSLPDGFPSALAPPSGAKITSGNKLVTNGKSSYIVAATLSGSVEQVYAGLKSQITGAGYTVSGDSLMTNNGEAFGIIGASNSTYELSATVGKSSTGSGTDVAMTLTQK